MSVTPTPIEVFCSYADEDEPWLHKLEQHLEPLQQQGLISLWNKQLIPAGTHYKQALNDHVETASIVLLLVSIDFLTSDDYLGIEMKHALARQESGEARVIPILVRKVNWKNTLFAHLQVLPINRKPLALLTSKDKEESALVDIAAHLRRIIEEERTKPVSNPSRTVLPTILNIPYSNNQYFTGCEVELQYLHDQLQNTNTAAIGQTQSISGLGGIGKTCLAIEYAHRYRNEYTTLLWAYADNQESLNASYADIARILHLPEKEEKGQIIVQAVKDWLRTHRDYLLILDNADKPELLTPFIPPHFGGHLLITTRAIAVRNLNIVNPLILETLTTEQGALLLLHRAGWLAHGTSLAQASPEDQLQAQEISQELGGLPLALEQAAAYLEETGMNLTSYLQTYRQHRTHLFEKHQPLNYRHTVATTWKISFTLVEERNPAAADLLRFCAFLAPDIIPEAILTKGAEALGPVLSPIAGDAHLLGQAIAALRAYSLITRDRHEPILSVHRLVQAVLRDSLDPIQQRIWAERAIGAMNKALPEFPITDWQKWLPYLPQVYACSQLIDEYTIVTEESGKLLNQAGAMLRYYARPTEAEKMYERALRIYEHVLGPEHPETATTLDTLATVVGSQGKYEQALRLFERALSIRERVLGPEHPDTATTINGIALLYSHWGRFKESQLMSESQHMYERALSIRKRVLGPEHPDTATTLANLAMLYRTWGKFNADKYEQAENFFEQALRIYEHALGPEHAITTSTINDLAGIYHLRHKYEQADSLFKRVLHIQEQTVGIDHIATATTISKLARLYKDQGAYEQSLNMYKRALHIRERVFGVDHPNTTITNLNIGQLYQKQGNYQQAEELFRQALTTHEQALGAEHVKVATILQVYAELLRELGRNEEAEQFEIRVEAIRNKSTKPSNRNNQTTH